MVSMDGDTKLKNVHGEPGRPEGRNLNLDGTSLVLKLYTKCKTQVCSYILYLCIYLGNYYY